MRYLSVCSGIEAASVAWHDFGWTPVGFSEIDAFPSAVLAHRFPHVPNLGDMTKYKEWPLEPGSIDILVGGTPCFVAGTLILTKRGLVSIEQVKVGDEVITHRNRWKKVVRIGSKMAPTRRLKGQGHHGLITTDEHPFYASKVEPKWDNESRSYKRSFSPLDWTEAKDLAGQMWAMPTSFPPSDAPAITLDERERVAPEITLELMRLVGAWVGDGWVRDSPRPDRKASEWGIVHLCAGFGAKTEQMHSWLDATGLRYASHKERTTTRFTIYSKAFARWLTENFGRYADGKTIPTWLLGASQAMREAFLEGYLGTDGFLTSNGYAFSTVSKRLAFGITMLIQSTRRHAVTMRLNVPNRVCCIEGRKINEQPSFVVRATITSRSSVEREGFRLGLVRKSEPTGLNQEVFNVEVEDDHSYLADGICVHNCQSFSVAGLRKGLEDPRGSLMLTYLAIAEHFRIPTLLWENVPGVLSSNGGRDFGAFLGALGELGYRWAYRVLDAQYFGVPQRRRRVFVVASASDRIDPESVLFEPEGVRGDSAPRRKARKGSAAALGAGVDERGLQRTVGTLCADTHPGAYSGQDAYTGRLVPHINGSHWDDPNAPHPTLNRGGMGQIGYSNQEIFSQRGGGLVPSTQIYSIQDGREINKAQNGLGISGPDATAYTIDTTGAQSVAICAAQPVVCATGATAHPAQAIPIISDAARSESAARTPSPDAEGRVRLRDPGLGIGAAGDPMFTLTATAPHAVAQPVAFAQNQVGEIRTNPVMGTLNTNSNATGRNTPLVMAPASQPIILDSYNQTVQEQSFPLRVGTGNGTCDAISKVFIPSPMVDGTQIVQHFDVYNHRLTGDVTGVVREQHGTNMNAIFQQSPMVVRRLTPVECERLQGFPDGWTDIPYRGKPAADGPRYKALGNSMAVPVMRWIGQRIRNA